jgi:hypothetical protein
VTFPHPDCIWIYGNKDDDDDDDDDDDIIMECTDIFFGVHYHLF